MNTSTKEQTMTAEIVTTFAHTLRDSVVTVLVPGTDKAVTFDRDSYAGQAVRLHAADRHPYTDGEAIGTLGSMVRHGNLAHLGRPNVSVGYVANDDVLAWWVAREPKADTAIRMVLVHLGLADLPEGAHDRRPAA